MERREKDLKELEELRAYYDEGDLSELIEKGEEVHSSFTEEDYDAWKKRKMRQISLRLPEDLVSDIKKEAMKHGIGYQTLIRLILASRFQRSPGASSPAVEQDSTFTQPSPQKTGT